MGWGLLHLALTVIKERLELRIQIVSSRCYCSSFMSAERLWVFYILVRVRSKVLNIMFWCSVLGLW
jgi:hypothetical protein